MYNLPSVWCLMKLANIVEKFESGGRPKGGVRHIESGIPSLGGEHLTNDGKFDFSKIKYIPIDFFYNMSKGIIKRGDILIVKDGATTGKVSYVRDNFPFKEAAINEHIFLVRPFREVNKLYLFYFLYSSYGQNYVKANFKGTAQGGINLSFAENTSVPLPPLPEQHKIVEKIEELFTKLDAGVYALKKIKEQIKQYRQSVLKSAFEGKLTERWREENKDKLEPASALLNNLEEVKVRRNVPKVTAVSDDYQKWSIPKMWNLISVAESLRKGVLEDVKDGNHGSNHPKKNEFSREGLPFITSNLVEDFKVDYRAAPKIKGKPLERIKVGFSYPGDVILTHKGSVGRVGICEKDCVLTPQTTYYRCNKNIIKNRYLAYALASPIIQFQLSGVKSQTTRDFVSISKQYYLFFPFCLFPEQQKIVEEIEKRFSVADEVEQTVNKSLEQAEKLRQSILNLQKNGGNNIRNS